MSGRSYGSLLLRINGVAFPIQRVGIQMSGVEVEARANADGSVYYVETPQPLRFEIEFEGTGMPWSPAYMRASIDLTFREDSNGRTHTLTAAKFTGKPDYDANEGKISGVAIEGSYRNYRVTG